MSAEPDPDLVEAREVCAKIAGEQYAGGKSADYREGRMDGAITVKCALLGIKRGRELERTRA